MEHFAYCPTGIENFKANNQWFRKGSLPKNGNIIFFDWDGDSISYYVGIVEKVENEVVYTIEENSGNKIAKLSYEKIALISWVMVFRKQHIFLNKCLIISTFFSINILLL